jgi:hypothetical protein
VLSIVSISFRHFADLPVIAARLFLIATRAISVRGVISLFVVQHGAEALYQLGPAAKVVSLTAHNPLNCPEPGLGLAIEVIEFSNALCMYPHKEQIRSLVLFFETHVSLDIYFCAGSF